MKIRTIFSPVKRVTEHFGIVYGIVSGDSKPYYFVVSLDKPDNAISAYINRNCARQICLYLEGLNYHRDEICCDLEFYALDRDRG